MNKIHRYELTHNKGEHINYSNRYVWECAACGNEITTLDKIMPRGTGCVPVQIRTVKSTVKPV